ncbi:MAG: hypothetical protein IK125_01440 [Lachnospiraceae bacterium]|nr:hypothetical protein [Lachnospiraceae bacterium]
MEQRTHRNASFIRLLLPMMCMIICMIGSLYACSAPKVVFPTDDEIRALVLTQLRDSEFSNVTKFVVFEIHDRVSDAKKKEDSMRIDLAFVADDIYYSRSYSLTLHYENAWKIVSIEPYEQDNWTDYPMAGVSEERFLKDLNGLSYSAGGIDYTLTTKDVVYSDVDKWENLPENRSGISMKMTVTRDSLVHTLSVSGEYRYLPGQGWIQSGKFNINVIQKITATITDEMITMAIEKLRVSYLEHDFDFKELSQVSWRKNGDASVDHENNEATVHVIARGETDLLYVETDVSLIFKYSDGWYYYRTESYGTEIKVGYRNSDHAITEQKLRETLIANKFRYGYAPDATLTEENISDLEITDYHILQDGKRQQLSFKYTLVFDRATVSISGESVYAYDEATDAFSLASRSSSSNIEQMRLQGCWYGKIKHSPNVDQYLMLVLNEMDEKGDIDAVLVYRCVELDSDMTPDTSSLQGALHMQGHCDTENMLRLTFASVGWLKMTKYSTISRLSGYFDFAANCLASDVNTDITFSSDKPEGFPDLTDLYNSIVQSAQ